MGDIESTTRDMWWHIGDFKKKGYTPDYGYTKDESFVFGFMDGYFIEAVLKFWDCKLLHVAVADPDNMEAEMKKRDLKWMLKTKRLHFIHGTDAELADIFWRTCEGKRVAYTPHDDFNEYAVTRYPEISKAVTIAVAGTEMSDFENKWVAQNYVHNLEDEKAGAFKDIRTLFGTGKGRNGVFVGAGPSLDKTIGALIELKRDRPDTYLLVAGQAAKKFVNAIVEPDAVIYADWSELGWSHFDNRYWSKWKHGLPLIQTQETRFMIARRHSDRTLIFDETGRYQEKEFTDVFSKYGSIEHANTVSTFGLDLLIKMGFDNALMFGVDYGYPYEGKTHADGYRSDGQDHIYKKDFMSNCEIKNTKGDIIKTSVFMQKDKEWSERRIERCPTSTQVIQVSDGAFLTGATNISSEEAPNLLPLLISKT